MVSLMSICTINDHDHYNYAKTKVHYNLKYINQVKSKSEVEFCP